MLAPCWAVAAALLATLVATRAIYFGDPAVEPDEQLYSYIGWRMTQGDLPYLDQWDRKPFGLFAIFAAAHALFGPEAIAFQLVAALAAGAGAALLYTVARRQVDRIAATVAAALYVVYLGLYGSQSGQSEGFHTPMMLAMLWLVQDPDRPDAGRRALLAMMLGGAALQVKYTVLPQCLLFGAWALWGEWRRNADHTRLAGRAAIFAALGLLPTLLVALFYSSRGHFDAFWFANFVSQFDRITPPGGRWRFELLVSAVPLAALLLAAPYAAWRLAPPRDGRAYRLYALWLLAALATALIPGTVYRYYLGALIAPAILLALPLLDRKGPFRIFPGAILLGLALALYNPIARLETSRAERQATAQLAAALSPHVGAQRDCLLVFDGPTVLYRLTQSCQPSRFVYPDHLNNALEVHALGIDRQAELARILKAQPGAVVTSPQPLTLQDPASAAQLRRALDRDYRELVTVTLNGRKITGWARNPADPARSATGTAPRR